MILDENKVKILLQSGMCFVCSMCLCCLDGNGKCGKENCGGPIVGRDYPDYRGPLENFVNFCFACGDESEYGIKVKNGKKIVGVCKEHVGYLNQLVPVDRADLIEMSERLPIHIQ